MRSLPWVKNVKVDTAGKPVKIGDKVVTCMIFKDDPEITMYDLNKQNVGGADVYGLLPDDDVHLNGWFSDYILIREGSTVFNVSDLDLKSRVLIEPCAVLVHAVERAKTTGILRFQQQSCCSGMWTDRSDLYRSSSYNGYREYRSCRRRAEET